MPARLLPNGELSQRSSTGLLPRGVVQIVSGGGGGGDTTKPMFPVGASISLVGGTVTASGFQLSWTPATDNSGTVLYKISTDGGATYPITWGSANYTFSGLTAGTTYAIRVQAIDPSGNLSDDILSFSQATSAAGATLTSQPLVRNVSVAGVPVVAASVALTWVRVYDTTTGDRLLTVTGLSTDSLGVFSFNNASLVAGTNYEMRWREAGGQQGFGFATGA